MPQIQGNITKVPTASATGTTTSFLQANTTEIVASQLHGRLGSAAYNGNLFMASTAAAGVTIPISTTTSPTFTLLNPIGSSVNCELLAITIGITVVTSVASPILLGYLGGVTSATNPTSTTARAITNAKLNSGNSPLANLFTAATLAAAVTTFATIGQITATNATAGNSLGPWFSADLQGGILLTPGSLVHVCGSAAQTSPTTITLWYAEYPV